MYVLFIYPECECKVIKISSLISKPMPDIENNSPDKPIRANK
jgi:hypothetical protein